MMFQRFHDYLASIRPSLGQAFSRELRALLNGISLREPVPLMETLQAGKMIRGSLSCMIGQALGGTLESVLPRAVAVELIQSATLLHDDFVDQDIFRRQRPATWTLEGARRAVLIGDVMFASAIKMMSDLSREDGAAVSDAIAQVSRGALHEPLEPSALVGAIGSERWRADGYPEIIRLKTGVLFGTACRLGTIAAGGGVELREASYGYGVRLGEAYQIADDLQDVNRCLLKGTVRLEEMVSLAPMFLHFLPDTGPYLSEMLESRRSELGGIGVQYFREARASMESEIERRLELASSEIGEHFSDNAYVELMRKAPRDLVSMLTESETSAPIERFEKAKTSLH